MSGIDWTTTEGCDRCNEHGPFLPGGAFSAGDAASREAHQAWHGLVATVLPWQWAYATTERLTNALTLPRRKP